MAPWQIAAVLMVPAEEGTMESAAAFWSSEEFHQRSTSNVQHPTSNSELSVER